MITIIDYGLGNIRAFANVYERLNILVSIAKTNDDLKDATKIILPGVGAFDFAMSQLNKSGMRETLDKLVLEHQLPVIGICIGMQILAKSSDEGVSPGLGWLDATVKRFDASFLKSKTQLPHMGWNTIHPNNDNPMLVNISDDSRFYFLHSYYFQCNNPKDMIATTEYGIQYASAVNKKNIYGVQFHPEKSHQWGIQLLKNFADL
ncbi:MAG: imidazole glycerol phosphate synthase, glutamine amidotransferase subunit [Candidatus Schekmanbacteria bacterium GWA2_38_11]|uniref:Imidazole glycerol phosphate synthase subunit HisH n=1 Tax=Candidatus Schekmanbacteria bacterium GWA2_38_11 TaxID=1817876 RepID=A0A1F7RLJ8_9BACT|nr:MAG: imidazole glycerol phosphate synthase, glutamine amidotransferase subunit [Candidatus Schekmanbacteria bacterium GWA2_38_11]